MRTLLLSLLSFLVLATQAQPDNAAIRSLADVDLKPFYHGVSSGDPTSNSVIIWTRVTPEVDGPVVVTWRVATDAEFTDTLQEGTIITDADRDYTVKIDVTGLQPYTYYYYEFETEGELSVVGRTKTTPDGPVDQLRFAVVACSNYPAGYFNVYEKITERNDLDAVIHLGDFIYESGGSSILQEEWPRSAPPNHEIITLNDYRIRLSSYKLDSDSRKMHQNYPLIAVWDDHESADNSWRDGANNHQANEGPWADRKAASIQAYYEYMPLRQPDPNNFTRIWRKISYGSLADLYMIDTRLYDRDLQSETPTIDDPERKLIGPEQMQWLQSNMATSTAQWQVIGNQVVMTPIVIPNYLTEEFVAVNNDQWDGYNTERKALYDFILEADIDNLVVLTGDIHTAWANDLPYSIFDYNKWTGEGSVGVEFVCNSVTSSGFPFDFPLGINIVQTLMPYIKYLQIEKKGYCLLDLTAEKAQGDFYNVPEITQPTSPEFWQQGWYADDGESFLKRNFSPTSNAGPLEPLAPELPRDTPDSLLTATSDITQFDVLGVYPNPFINDLLFELHLFENAEVSLMLYDTKGAEVIRKDYGRLPRGRNLLVLHDLNALANAMYEAILIVDNEVIKRRVIKME